MEVMYTCTMHHTSGHWLAIHSQVWIYGTLDIVDGHFKMVLKFIIMQFYGTLIYTEYNEIITN